MSASAAPQTDPSADFDWPSIWDERFALDAAPRAANGNSRHIPLDAGVILTLAALAIIAVTGMLLGYAG